METKNRQSLLYIITLAYFALGFINITLALSALLCMILPFYLVYRDRKLSWCVSACPRADYLKKVGRFSRKRPIPRALVSKKTRSAVLSYFCLNLMFAIMSSIMVSRGAMAPIDKVRFLIVFQIPWSLPQLVVFEGATDVLIHLSYRLYSIMFTSTVIGTVLALRYRPRTWCAVCPMNSMSANLLKNLKQQSQ